jgi:NitT/TauT family transport system substrate-binding protein
MNRSGFSLQCILLVLVAAATSFAQEKPPPAADAELVETRREVPRLKGPEAYQPKDKVVEIELSEYAGYAGLIAANGGLEPNENSYFFKKHKFRVKLTLSEEESWSALNSGRMAASATTADVLAVYGKQFEVAVPALIGFSRGADGVVVRNDIKRVNDLKGKIVSTCQFTESDFFIRYLAQEAGLGVNLLDDFSSRPDPDKVNLIVCADGFGAGDLFLRDVESGRNRLAGCVTWAPKTTEVAEGSHGKAHVLVTNRNLLIVADVLIVNRSFAKKHPEMVAGLVDGVIAGNGMIGSDPKTCMAIVRTAFKWDEAKAAAEMSKVHLANLPENIAFFDGTIDSAGSYGFIYESAVAAYGRALIPKPADGDGFVDLTAIKALQRSGAYAEQRARITPIKTVEAQAEDEPLLSKNIRFLFEPNTAKLDLAREDNAKNLESIARTLKISPGSHIRLIGHTEPSLKQKYRNEGGEVLVRKIALTALQLSKDRAAEIGRLLVEKYGVDESRIQKQGRGWDEPASDSIAENRRVEMQWFTIE